MVTWYYSFQLSRIHCIETRSKGSSDSNLVTFGVLVNQRDQGHGAIVAPIFRGSSLTPADLMESARLNGYRATFSSAHMGPDWMIGPTEMRDGDGVGILVTATNTNDSQLPTGDQQKIDRMTLSAFNIYYSWMAGNFISGLGLGVITEFVGSTIGEAGGAIGAIVADPVGWALGYEPQGPCNGLVFGANVSRSSRDLESLEWAPDPYQWATGPVEMAVLTQSLDDSDTHPQQNCGPIARTEIDITVRRSQTWSMRRQNWRDPVLSVRHSYPSAAGLKAAAGIRL
jgi:hypothetical protein